MPYPKRLLPVLVFVALTGLSHAAPQDLKQGALPTLQAAKSQYPSIVAKLQSAIDDLHASLLDDQAPDCDPSDAAEEQALLCFTDLLLHPTRQRIRLEP